MQVANERLDRASQYLTPQRRGQVIAARKGWGHEHNLIYARVRRHVLHPPSSQGPQPAGG